MKECIEYKLHRDKDGTVSNPPWVTDGGHFKSADNSFVGFIPVEAERIWYIPDSVSKLTEAQFIQRGMAIHAKSPLEKRIDEENKTAPMNNTEATTMLRNFYKNKIAE